MTDNQEFYPYNDIGNAARYADLYKGQLQWVPELNSWFRWEKARWVPDDTGRHMELAKQVVEELANERSLLLARYKERRAALETDENISDADASKGIKDDLELKQIEARLEKLEKNQERLGYAGPLANMIKLAKPVEGMPMPWHEFDCKGKYLGVENGVIHLPSGGHVSDDPDYYITKSCTAKYDPDAQCPNWIAFLERILEDDADRIEYIQRVMGQALLGEAEKNRLIIFCGVGANGKSTLVDTMKKLLGDYAIVTSPNAVTHTSNSKEYYLASAKGARLILINETQKGALLDEQFVKSLVDSGEVTAREPYGKPFSFQPVATPIVCTNYQPRISADYAIARRLVFIPFDYKLPLEEQDPRFMENELVPELSGILNWALEGYRRYRESDLSVLPPSVEASTREFIAQNDRIGQFIEERCDKQPEHKEALTSFRDAYNTWCADNGYMEIAADRLGSDLRDREYEVRKSTGGRTFVFGLKIVSELQLKLDENRDDKRGPSGIVPLHQSGAVKSSGDGHS